MTKLRPHHGPHATRHTKWTSGGHLEEVAPPNVVTHLGHFSSGACLVVILKKLGGNARECLSHHTLTTLRLEFHEFGCWCVQLNSSCVEQPTQWSISRHQQPRRAKQLLHTSRRSELRLASAGVRSQQSPLAPLPSARRSLWPLQETAAMKWRK